MSTYLVTGGAGRLGVSVVEALAADGHEVVSVDRVTSAQVRSTQVEIDLLDRQATAALFRDVKPDGVVHLAAIAVPFERPDAEIFATNTGLAYSVLEASLASSTPRLLLASSPTVIGYGAPGGWAPQYLPIDEEHPVAPWHGYALSKVAVEELVAMAVRQHGDRLCIGAFRPCYVISPHEWEGGPTQQGHTVLERLDHPELSAVALFNYLDARDGGSFVLAWLRGADAVPNGSVFFVGAPDSLVRSHTADALAEYATAAALGAGLAPTASVFSSEKARQLLGWSAIHTWRAELASLPGAEEAGLG